MIVAPTAVILAGGLGLRLRSVVADRPKPMAPIQQKPFLEHQLTHLRRQGFTRVILCVGYLAEQIQHYFGNGQTLGLTINYVVEGELLGTAGALKNAAPLLATPFLVLNGDSFLDLDFRELLAAHQRHCKLDPATIATIVAVSMHETGAYGCLHFDQTGSLQRFVEKGVTGPGWINGGAYLCTPMILDYIPAQQVVSLEKSIFPQLIAGGGRLYAYPFTGFFVDIGTPAGYQTFTQVVATGSPCHAGVCHTNAQEP